MSEQYRVLSELDETSLSALLKAWTPLDPPTIEAMVELDSGHAVKLPMIIISLVPDRAMKLWMLEVVKPPKQKYPNELAKAGSYFLTIDLANRVSLLKPVGLTDTH